MFLPLVERSDYDEYFKAHYNVDTVNSAAQCAYCSLALCCTAQPDGADFSATTFFLILVESSVSGDGTRAGRSYHDVPFRLEPSVFTVAVILKPHVMSRCDEGGAHWLATWIILFSGTQNDQSLQIHLTLYSVLPKMSD